MWWLALLMLFWPLQLAAQTIPVRAAEHGDFTRIVLDLQPNTKWDVKKNDAVVQIDLDGAANFSLENVFTRLSENRVLAIRPEPGGETARLMVKLGCGCDIKSYMVGQTMLVIDISPQIAPKPILAQAPPEKIELSPFLLPQLREKTQNTLPQAAVPVAPPPAPLHQVPAPHDFEPLLRNVIASGIRDQQLEPQKDVQIEAAKHENSPLKPLDHHQLMAPSCPDQALYDFRNWRQYPFSEGVDILATAAQNAPSSLRQDLVLHYLSYGFGAEALQALGPQNADTALLGALAHMVDGGPPAGPTFAQLAHCGPIFETWALIEGHSPLPPAQTLPELLHLLMSMPAELKQVFFPDLIARFTHQGDLESAGILDRNYGVIATPQPRAIAHELPGLIASAAETQQVLSPETAELAAAYAFEEAGSFEKSKVLALAGAGAFQEALSYLAKQTDEAGDVRTDVVRFLAVWPDDVQFAAATLQHVDFLSALPQPLRQPVAQRAQALGFLAAASALGALPDPSMEKSEDRKPNINTPASFFDPAAQQAAPISLAAAGQLLSTASELATQANAVLQATRR
jgi:hypothetical protein